MDAKFTAITTTKKLNLLGFDRDMATAAQFTKTGLLRNFRRTVKTWRRKAVFTHNINSVGFRYVITVGTNDPLYYEINWGTPFMTDVLSRNFVPKTRPGVLDSFPGRGHRLRRGGPPRAGIIPRRFDLAAAKEEERLMLSRLRNIIDRWAQQSGHQI